METNAIQMNIAPLPGIAEGAHAPSAASGSSFQDHLNRALGNGPSSGKPELMQGQKAFANEDSRLPGAGSPSGVSPNHPSHAVQSVPGVTGVSGAATPVLVASAGGLNGASSASSSGAAETGASGPAAQTGNLSRLRWLTEMLPDSLLGGIFHADVSSGKPSSEPSSNQASPSGPSGSLPPAAAGAAPTSGSIPNPTDAANALLTEAPAGAPGSQATVTLAASAQGSQPANSGAIPAASPDASQMQRALKTLESAGLSLASTSASANGVPLPSVTTAASPSIAMGHPAQASASIPHVAQPSRPATDDASQTAARDAGIGNAAQASAAARGDSVAAAKPPAGSAGSGSKNDASQNSKPSNSPQGAGNLTAAAAEGSASITGAATQVASSGFALAVNQAAQSANAVAHAGSPTQPAAGQGAEKVAAAMDNAVNAPGGAVTAASLVQTQGKTEMRVALQTESMGTLQLHAVLDGGRVGASIAVVNHEAHTLLTNELPALQQTLNDQNVRVDHLTVINAPMTSGSGAGNSRGSQDFNQPRDQSAHWFSPLSVPVAATVGKDAPAIEDIRRRLSVRA